MTACQQQSPSNSTDGGTVAAKSPAPGDPDYVAEDPRLAMAVDTDGAAFRTFGIRRFPAIALIDKQGRLTKVIGPDDADIGAAVATLTKPE